MRLLEICFWNVMYWALYLPCSIILNIITEKGDLVAIVLIGVIITAVMTIWLSFSDGVLLEEEMKPVIIENEPVEVEYEEPIDLEPEPKMRTDVDLGQLDADDDDVLG